MVVIDLSFGSSASVLGGCAFVVDQSSRRSPCRAFISSVFASIDGIDAQECRSRQSGVLDVVNCWAAS